MRVRVRPRVRVRVRSSSQPERAVGERAADARRASQGRQIEHDRARGRAEVAAHAPEVQAVVRADHGEGADARALRAIGASMRLIKGDEAGAGEGAGLVVRRVREEATKGPPTLRELPIEGTRQLEGRRGLQQPNVSAIPGDPLVGERAIHEARGEGNGEPGAGTVECAVHGVERRAVGAARKDDRADSGEAALN